MAMIIFTVLIINAILKKPRQKTANLMLNLSLALAIRYALDIGRQGYMLSCLMKVPATTLSKQKELLVEAMQFGNYIGDAQVKRLCDSEKCSIILNLKKYFD